MEALPHQAIKEFVTAAHKVAANGLLRYSSGNMSCRLDGGMALITASGTWLGELTEADVSAVRLINGQTVSGKRPSIEAKFHIGILRSRPDVNVVLHYQSPYATAIACSNRRDYNFYMTNEIPFYIGQIGWVDFLLPGSEELTHSVTDAMRTNNLVLLQNHGQVVAAKTYNDALQMAGFFELACQIILTNKDALPLPQRAVEKLIEMARISNI